MRTGVFYLQEQAAQTEGGRGLIEDKVVVSVVGEPLELGKRLHWEALRGGLGRARRQLFLEPVINFFHIGWRASR